MSKLKRKVFFVAATDFSVNAFLINHLRVISKYLDVTVIVNTNDPLFLKKQGLNVIVIPLAISRKVSIFSDLFCLSRLIYLFIKNKPDAVHSITPKAGLLTMLAGFFSFIPLRVHTFTGQVWVTKEGLKRFFLKGFDGLIARLATFNIVDSPSQRDFLIQEKVLSENDSIVFGLGSVSGVDLQRFKANKKNFLEVRRELQIPDDAFVFIYLGRLNRDKGVLDLAKAFAKIKYNDAYLLIVGPDEGAFVEQIKSFTKGLVSYVRFVEFTQTPSRYLAAANVLCLPSYREGFGSVIIEAAAMGLPAIASDIYGISDAVVNHQTGMLHNAGDVEAIYRSMNYFLNHPADVQAYGFAARARAAKDFDADVLSAYWLDFYKRYLPQK